MPDADEQSEGPWPSFGGPGAALLLALLWLGMLLAGGTDIDRAILIGSHVGDRPWEQAAILVTRLGDWEVLVALTLFGAAWLIYRRRWRMAVVLLGSTLIARVAVGLQKMLFARVRPAEDGHLVEVQSLSFPSGHAANAMIVYVMLALLLAPGVESRRTAVIAAVLLSLLIGASRVALGVHWPSDVVGGWAFGLLWVMAVMRWMSERLDLRTGKEEG